MIHPLERSLVLPYGFSFTQCLNLSPVPRQWRSRTRVYRPREDLRRVRERFAGRGSSAFAKISLGLTLTLSNGRVEGLEKPRTARRLLLLPNICKQ